MPFRTKMENQNESKVLDARKSENGPGPVGIATWLDELKEQGGCILHETPTKTEKRTFWSWPLSRVSTVGCELCTLSSDCPSQRLRSCVWIGGCIAEEVYEF